MQTCVEGSQPWANRTKSQTDEQSPVKSQGDKMLASQSEQHANKAPLTLADMEKLLKSIDGRIITKLSDQLSTDRSTTEQHGQTIQHLETSLNDMEVRLANIEFTSLAPSKENERLVENRSWCNNIHINGSPGRVEGAQPTTSIEVLLKEIFGTDSFLTPLTVNRVHIPFRLVVKILLV